MAFKHHAPHIVNFGVRSAGQGLAVHGLVYQRAADLSAVFDNALDHLAKSQHARQRAL